MATITEAKVTLGAVAPDDQLSRYLQGGNVTTFYPDYTVVNHYVKDRHIYMVPIASPSGFNGDSTAFVQLASPTLLWIADWTTLKVGEPPEFPDTVPVDPAWVLLDDGYESHNLTVVGDGRSALFRLSGTYVFGHKRPRAKTHQQVTFGRPPWLDDSGLSRTLSDSLATRNILDSPAVSLGIPVAG